MLTRRRLEPFRPSWEWSQDGPRVVKWITDYFLSLEDRGALAIRVDDLYGFSGYVSVLDWGAKGDGSTDDGAAIQGAITNAPAGATIFVPPGSYRSSVGITVPPGKSLVGLGGGSDTGAAPTQIIFDLAVATCVTLDGGADGDQMQIRNIAINRAAGAVPAGSTGLFIKSTNNPVIEDVVIYRQAIGVKTGGTGVLGATFTRLQTTAISGTHVWLESAYESRFIFCRFGKNGASDVSCNEYVRFKGAVDTTRFTSCQFNQSNLLTPTTTRALYFDGYDSPNGIFDFVQCHFELCTDVIAETGTVQVPARISFVACSIFASGTFFQSLPSGFINDFQLIGCPVVSPTFSIANAVWLHISGNHFSSNVTLDACGGSFVGNSGVGNMTFQGAQQVLAIADNICAGTMTDASSGKFSYVGNEGDTSSYGQTSSIPGALQLRSHANGQAIAVQSLTELTTIAAAASTDTTIQKPAGAIILAVTVRVTTVIPTATTFTVGDAGNAARFSTAAVSTAAGSTDKGTAAGAYYNATAGAIRITPNASPANNSGRVRVTIHYISLTAPTS